MSAFITVVVPRIVADLIHPLPAAPTRYRLRYPDSGRVSPVQAAVWLCDSADWPLGGEYEGAPRFDPRVQAVARRLLFMRWLHAGDHARRGGRGL